MLFEKVLNKCSFFFVLYYKSNAYSRVYKGGGLFTMEKQRKREKISKQKTSKEENRNVKSKMEKIKYSTSSFRRFSPNSLNIHYDLCIVFRSMIQIIF